VKGSLRYMARPWREVRPRRQTISPHDQGRGHCILIVDDNAYIRQALCDPFTHELDFELCGEAQNEKEAIAKAREFEP